MFNFVAQLLSASFEQQTLIIIMWLVGGRCAFTFLSDMGKSVVFIFNVTVCVVGVRAGGVERDH